MNEALRDWVANVHDTFYIIGTVAGPHPYPAMVRDFQSVIGARGARADAGSRRPPARPAGRRDRRRLNAIGLFHPFLDDPSVEMLGVEAAGHGSTAARRVSLAGGRPGVLHGNKTYLLQDDDGQIPRRIRSRRARLSRHRAGAFLAARDRPGRLYVGHRYRGAGRLPALLPHRRHHPRARTRHALAASPSSRRRWTRTRSSRSICAGRGDKDIFTVAEASGGGRYERASHRPPQASPRSSRAKAARRSSASSPPAIRRRDDHRRHPRRTGPGGADVIELGMPFTDPMADGPAIQAANLRSAGRGHENSRHPAHRRRFPRAPPRTPLVLMGYANPMTGAARTGSRRKRQGRASTA
jgi:hypothetical protein